ncbi:MAG: hypothetical protein PVF97_12075 [Desulfobacterales bacterium]
MSHAIPVVRVDCAVAAVFFFTNLVRSDIVGILVVRALMLSGILTVKVARAGIIHL